MVALEPTRNLFSEYDDLAGFEKIGRRHNGPMPVRRANAAHRARYRTEASRRASRSFSHTAGGVHRRRRRFVY